MAKKTTGEQLDLIDVDSPEAKAIKKEVRKYIRLRNAHNEAGTIKNNQRDKLIDTIKGAGLHKLEDGSYKVNIDGVVTTVTPRSDSLNVKETNKQESE